MIAACTVTAIAVSVELAASTGRLSAATGVTAAISKTALSMALAPITAGTSPALYARSTEPPRARVLPVRAPAVHKGTRPGWRARARELVTRLRAARHSYGSDCAAAPCSPL